ncbi:phosphoglycerate dehydrogenase-like enzyme [Rhizobium sp. BK313]|uniref:NAD(P)-dependent oxidoreductase n=1 Tax=Rhizobium sp. BK313 TaxID=2587081 RepID=UPI00105F91EE|nr:NAD(P)-dependent oxidoreductase [Rhizobium sp. BK313]MBB3458187.1 phosphoglycerate dehydrogenase-like enzyme [Rhizobium sp. BK313]
MRPVIACNMDEYQVERLRAHESKPILLNYAEAHSVWDVPADAEILFTFFKGWNSAPVERPPTWPRNLKWVQVGGAGVDAFPSWFFDAPLVTTGRGITADAIAEYAIAAIFAHEKQLFDGLRVSSAEQWKSRTLGLVSGKRLGILGLGAIGVQTATKARALGMEVGFVRRSSGISNSAAGLRQFASLREMVADVDHLLLAVPLTRETRRILDRDILRNAKPGLHVINVCRGEVIDDDALLEALDQNRISAATLDVTFPEPLPEGHAFYHHPRIRLTPHISYTSEDTVERMSARLLANLDRYLAGERLDNAVDAARGY